MSRHIRPPQVQAQRGIALVVVLILLLVMTLLGLASLRGTLMEERMSASLYDRSLSFQAAEAALREAEARLTADNILAQFPTSGCNGDGLCAKPEISSTGDRERWDPRHPGYNTFFTDASSVDGITATPQYFIEYMGDAPGWFECDRKTPMEPTCMKPRFRITARSSAAGRAQVVLQSSFAAF